MRNGEHNWIFINLHQGWTTFQSQPGHSVQAMKQAEPDPEKEDRLPTPTSLWVGTTEDLTWQLQIQ